MLYRAERELTVIAEGGEKIQVSPGQWFISDNPLHQVNNLPVKAAYDEGLFRLGRYVLPIGQIGQALPHHEVSPTDGPNFIVNAEGERRTFPRTDRGVQAAAGWIASERIDDEYDEPLTRRRRRRK